MYFGLFSIFVIKPIQPDCDKIKGISVLLLETPLTRSKYFSPYTHAQRLTQTSRTFCTFAYEQTLHYHEPGTVSCKTVEDLKKLYPNSFDRLGSLKGAYNIRIDPSVKLATHARRKVPIESKEAIDRELDYLIEE